MKILYVCTHNRCRSVLSEALTNHLGGGKIEARSAGSQPVGEVHPLTKHYLAECGIPTNNLSSKSWDDMGAFKPDIVVTVCDSAAGESCPVWMGETLKLHWGLEDPSKIEGSDAQKAKAFRATIAEIEARVQRMLAYNFKGMDADVLRNTMAELGAH